jgi:hypothetical protein
MADETFGPSVAEARAAGHDVRRELYLGRDTVLVLVKGNRGETKLAELTTGWHLDLKDRIEPVTGAHYYRLFIDDPTGERLQVLKDMAAVRFKGTFYKPISKPSFAAAVPSYVFRVQDMGPQLV